MSRLRAVLDGAVGKTPVHTSSSGVGRFTSGWATKGATSFPDLGSYDYDQNQGYLVFIVFSCLVYIVVFFSVSFGFVC